MTFEIYFSDLNEDAQNRLLKFVGAESPDEMNWDMDILPVATFEIEEDLGGGMLHERNKYGSGN